MPERLTCKDRAGSSLEVGVGWNDGCMMAVLGACEIHYVSISIFETNLECLVLVLFDILCATELE